ncbi:MAG TPA: hypothetical protein VEJ44_06940, partial [Acidimicrobiales bacterium]|nr:hypothetical protein [Acidimicrobiales bacterium]
MKRVGDRRQHPAPPPIPRVRRRRGRLTAFASAPVLLLSATVATTVATTSTAHAAPAPAAVRVGLPPPVPTGAQPGATLPSSAALDVDVVLTPRDPAGLAALAAAVTTVGGPEQGRFLRRGAFAS